MPGRQKTNQGKGEIGLARLPDGPAGGLSPELTHIGSSDALLQRKYSELTRRHLGHLFRGLFTSFTGLHFHVAWAPQVLAQSVAPSLPTACSVCCRLAGTSLAAQPSCRTRGPKQLVQALSRGGEGLAFKCRLGVRNYWLPIRVRDVLVGIAYLQCFERVSSFATGSEEGAACSARVLLSRTEFQRAARLLRLIIEHVQTLDLAALRKDELTSAGRAVIALEKEQVRLQDALRLRLSAPPSLRPRARPQSHPDQIVQHLLDCVARDYAKPLTLRRCAAALGNNPAYLCALFSQTVGIPFKTYLTAFRIKAAEQLLSDPAQTISQVAFAVGYASENRFRMAFRKVTGLAPKAWRETLRVSTTALMLFLLDQMELLALIEF